MITDPHKFTTQSDNRQGREKMSFQSHAGNYYLILVSTLSLLSTYTRGSELGGGGGGGLVFIIH